MADFPNGRVKTGQVHGVFYPVVLHHFAAGKNPRHIFLIFREFA
jgi:hypothetical protein